MTITTTPAVTDEGPRKAARARLSRRTDARWLGALALVLVAWFLWTFVAHDARFPLGPDAPVYLWWARLAGEEGLSSVGHRAGVPALTLVLEGVLGRSVVEITAALEATLGVAVGLAAAALVHSRTSRVGWLLVGALTGTFAVHLAAGYLANLAMAAAFLAAAAALATGTRRAAWMATALLAAGGLSHPLFFVVGAAILVLTAALAWRDDRAEALRVGGTVVGAGAIVGVGLLALLAGPSPPEVDTSRDAFLRRAGLAGDLRAAYLDRFVHRWARYVQWASVPLAVFGLSAASGFVGRFLRAWGVTLVAGVVIGLSTGWLPADRFVTFGFVIPILAGLGIVRLLTWFGMRRALGAAVAAALAVAMLGGAFIAWNRQEPFLSEDEVYTATVANSIVAHVDAGVPLVFHVHEEDESVSFLATRAGNVTRAALPPDRIRDVVILVPPFEEGGTERRALERLTASDVRAAEARSQRAAEEFVLTPFDDLDDATDATVIRPSDALTGGSPIDPLEPMSRAALVVSVTLTLAVVSTAGYGWARVVFANPVTAAAASPAVGASVLIVSAVTLERLGVPIDALVAAWFVSAVAGASGYLTWRVFERRVVPATPQIDEEPHE